MKILPSSPDKMKKVSSSGNILYLKKSNNTISNKKEVTVPHDSTESLLVSSYRTITSETTESLVPDPSSTEKYQETLYNDTAKNGEIQNVTNEQHQIKLHSEITSTTDSSQLQTSYNRDIFKNAGTYKRRFIVPEEKESTRPSMIHGFLATTGYPKFYIGESNCSWTLIAPPKQHVLLNILDLHLRCK